MQWYSGNISEAISLCKTQNSLFIVLVEDDSQEDPTNINDVWNDAEVSKIFSEHQYVALKLKANSELAKQFSQICILLVADTKLHYFCSEKNTKLQKLQAFHKHYLPKVDFFNFIILDTEDPVFVYPTLYFISSHGRPLETKVGHMSVNSLVQSAKRAFDLHDVSLHPMTSTTGAETPTSTTTTTTTPATTTATIATLDPSNTSNVSSTINEDMTADVAADTASALEDGKAAHHVDETNEMADNADSAAAAINAEQTAAESSEVSKKDEHLSLEEKTEKATRLLADKQADKAKEDAEKERQRELERRKLGQDMKKLKDLKADMERKELEKELKEKKEADRLAREQIRRQLQMDREERAKKYYNEKEEAANKQIQKEKEKTTSEIEKLEKENEAKMALARIQFRFPDGSSKVNQFNSSDHLSVARSFALQCLPVSFKNISLSTIHPRKVFKGEDYNQTFLHHGLVPSAVLVVLPSASVDVPPTPTPTSAVTSSNDSNFLYVIWTQIFLFFQYLLSFIFPSLNSGNDNSSASSASADKTATTTAVTADLNDATQLKHNLPAATTTAAATHSEPLPSTSLPSVAFGGARPKTSEGLRKRKEGNIHRLVADDEDDEQATWNGNSTQQM